MRLSIIIPVRNEAERLPATLNSLAVAAPGAERIVIDGGSKDDSARLARQAGARVISAPAGRGTQMHAGACAASGDGLWFVHADTLAPCAAAAQIELALRDPAVIAGNFCLRFEGTSAGARFLNALYPRLALIGLRYGDSGIFVRREAYEQAGGFRPLPIFEDLDLLRRLRRRGRIRTLPGPLCTSSRRFETRAFVPVFARWAGLQLLYWVGCDPVRLGRWYYPAETPPARPAEPRRVPS